MRTETLTHPRRLRATAAAGALASAFACATALLAGPALARPATAPQAAAAGPAPQAPVAAAPATPATASPAPPTAPPAGSLAAKPVAGKIEPALWVVKDADSTLYLFGTVHVLKPSLAWRTPKIATAFHSAEELWLEIDNADDQAAAQPLILKYGIDAKAPLSTKLDAADLARLEVAAKAAGLPGAKAMDPMRPWLASVTLSVLPLVQAGYDPKSGADTVLKAQATETGKPVKAFETLEQQLRFFADLPQPVEVAFLKATLDDVKEGPAEVEKMVEAWAHGDVAGLDRLMSAEMRDKYPDLYATLLTRRNQAWAKAIAERMKGKGVSFVAVGAAHLAGADSVQAELAKLGLSATRVE